MKRLWTVLLAVVVVMVAAVAVWVAFVRGEAPEAFQLTESAVEETPVEETPVPASTLDSLDGTWTVTGDSEAGYRVVEDLGQVLDFEAVGRTSEVSGTVDIDGSTVSAAIFEVDVASISSDDDRRDNQFVGPIMNAEEFPTANLVLTEPVDLGAVPVAGESVTVSVSGDLTLRGVTNPVTVDVEAQLLSDQIELVGSVDLLFSDFGIANPSNPLVAVRDDGEVEVRLLLVRS